jgi:uncharacterized protein (TIGR02001 family)
MTDYRYPRTATWLPGRPACQRRCDGGLRRAVLALASLLGSGLPLALHAQSTAFNGTVALSSQLVDRGQAITGNTPVLQTAVAWTFPAGWSAGLSAGATSSPGRVVEALAQVSRHWAVSADWQLQASLLYYRYPGTGRAGASDRTETGLDWTYRDVLTLGVSAIYVLGPQGHRPRGAADLNLHWPLAGHFAFSAGAGVAQSLATPYRSYRGGYGYAGRYRRADTGLGSYGHVGLLWSKGPWRIEVDRLVADAAIRRQWDRLGASPWVATISRSF